MFLFFSLTPLAFNFHSFSFSLSLFFFFLLSLQCSTFIYLFGVRSLTLLGAHVVSPRPPHNTIVVHFDVKRLGLTSRLVMSQHP